MGGGTAYPKTEERSCVAGAGDTRGCGGCGEMHGGPNPNGGSRQSLTSARIGLKATREAQNETPKFLNLFVSHRIRLKREELFIQGIIEGCRMKKKGIVHFSEAFAIALKCCYSTTGWDQKRVRRSRALGANAAGTRTTATPQHWGASGRGWRSAAGHGPAQPPSPAAPGRPAGWRPLRENAGCSPLCFIRGTIFLPMLMAHCQNGSRRSRSWSFWPCGSPRYSVVSRNGVRAVLWARSSTRTKNWHAAFDNKSQMGGVG